MLNWLSNNKYQVLLWFFIIVYFIYFSTFTILRHQALVSSYFDLGIMHQTVYNTYQGIKTGDLSLILEHTNPHGGGEQVKRMAIHNDIILALLAPFYFIYDGPETLLVIQTIVLAMGAWAVFHIAQHVLKDTKQRDFIALVFAFAYLMYPSMQRTNNFDFHAVAFSTTFLLCMFYFWLKKKYWVSVLFFGLTLLTKEQIGLTTAFLGAFTLWSNWKDSRNRYYSIGVIVASMVWFALSMLVIIPAARGGGEHFASNYYGYIKDDPLKVGFYLFHWDSWKYMFFVLGPLGFLSLLSPVHLLVAAPEFGINLLSSNWNMRNIFFHYTSVITPFVFISAIYGANRILHLKSYTRKILIYLPMLILTCTFLLSYFKSPLPYSREADYYPIQMGLDYKSQEQLDFFAWKEKKLKDPSLKISATGHYGAHLTSRRYFYNFSDDYVYADYVIVSLWEKEHGFQKDIMRPAYEKLKTDPSFVRTFRSRSFEVYQKLETDRAIVIK